jgi:hypothetical protein
MTDPAGATSANASIDVGRTMDLVAQATRRGASEPRAAAEQVWSATGLAVSQVLDENTTYAISHSEIRPVAFLAQAVARDNAVDRGLIEGAEAASQHVDRLLGRSASPFACSRPIRAHRACHFRAHRDPS